MAGVISLMTPLVIGLIFNTVQESINSQIDLTRLLLFISLLLVIEIGFWIFHGLGRVLEQKTGFFVYKNFILTGFIPAIMKWAVEFKTMWHYK